MASNSFNKLKGPHGWRAHKALRSMKLPIALPVKVNMGQKELNKIYITVRNKKIKVTMPKMPWDDND